MIQELTQQIRDELVHFDEQALEKQHKLRGLDEKIEESQKVAAATEMDLSDIQAEYDGERKLIEHELSQLEQERDDLKNTIGGLAGTKADLMSDNAKLEAENKKYREYEIAANKVLKAKEDSLIAREKELSEREQLKGYPKSLLPPE